MLTVLRGLSHRWRKFSYPCCKHSGLILAVAGDQRRSLLPAPDRHTINDIPAHVIVFLYMYIFLLLISHCTVDYPYVLILWSLVLRVPGDTLRLSYPGLGVVLTKQDINSFDQAGLSTEPSLGPQACEFHKRSQIIYQL